MYPVVDMPLPKAFESLQQPTKVLSLPLEEVAKNRKAWVDEWLEATTR